MANLSARSDSHVGGFGIDCRRGLWGVINAAIIVCVVE